MTPRRMLSLVLWVLGTSILLIPASAASSGGVDAALAWLRGAQLADGGFSSGFSDGSDIGATADAVMAIASAGEIAGPVEIRRSQPDRLPPGACDRDHRAGAGGQSHAGADRRRRRPSVLRRGRPHGGHRRRFQLVHRLLRRRARTTRRWRSWRSPRPPAESGRRRLRRCCERASRTGAMPSTAS